MNLASRDSEGTRVIVDGGRTMNCPTRKHEIVSENGLPPHRMRLRMKQTGASKLAGVKDERKKR